MTAESQQQQATLLQLESLQTKDDFEMKSNQQANQQAYNKDHEVMEQQKPAVASIKAPTDEKYFKRVQINNEKPPVKQIKPPI